MISNTQSPPQEREERVDKLLDAINKLSDQEAIFLVNNPPVADAEVDKVVKLRDPTERRNTDGALAKDLLKMRVTLTSHRSDEALRKWEAAIQASASGH